MANGYAPSKAKKKEYAKKKYMEELVVPPKVPIPEACKRLPKSPPGKAQKS